MFQSLLNVGGHSVVEEGDLGLIEVEGGHSLEKEEPVWARGGPWGLGGMEDGGVGAHEAHREHRKGCAKTGGLEYLGPPTAGREADARRAAEEVWFWDKSLVKAREVLVEVESGPSWAPLVQLKTEAEGAQVE